VDEARVGLYEAIDRERDYQDRKWGLPNHDLPGWLLILESELNEAKQAWVKGHGNEDCLRELLQVVAVGVAALEQHGVVER
jgi:hypothetical protein